MIKKEKIKFIEILTLNSMLENCINIPFNDIDALIKFIELREDLKKLSQEYQNKVTAVFSTYKVEKKQIQNGEVYDIENHEKFTEISEVLNKLQNEEKEVKNIRMLNIEPVEIYKLSAGLNNRDVDFIKDYLIKNK